MSEDTSVVQPTRVMRKISRDVPPNIPFLEFDRIAGRGGTVRERRKVRRMP